MGLEPNLGTVDLDSWGLKRLFSHGLRRWSSGAERPRVLGLRRRVSFFMAICQFFW